MSASEWVGWVAGDYKYYSHLTLKDGGLDCRKIKGGGTFRGMFIYRVYTPTKYETVKDDQKSLIVTIPMLSKYSAFDIVLI